MLRDGPTKVIENMNAIPNPLTAMPGFDLMKKQQEAFMKTMMGGVPGWGGSGPAKDEAAQDPAEELAEIKKQFAELQKKLSKL
jgi:polyhydroxyalkanoate synthesis regulator protein